MGFNGLRALLLLLLLIIPAYAVDYPSPVGYVNDFADIIRPADEARLNDLITDIERNTTVEIAVVTITSLQGEDIDMYAVKLFEKWGIGKKGTDNGLLILVAKDDRKYRIETGYGLEGTINAATAGRLGRDILAANFKQEKYGEGLYEAVLEVKALVEKDPDVVAKYASEGQESEGGLDSHLYTFLLFITSIAFAIVPSILGKLKLEEGTKKSLSSILGVILLLDFFIFVILPFLFIVCLLVFVFCITILLALSGKIGKGGRIIGTGWHSGGFGSGGGFGGFGGGRSGGGGSSGGW